MRQQPERYELHYQDETHLETNPRLSAMWHRKGVQPQLPAVGTNRRVTVFGSMEAFGGGRVEVVCARQDSAGFQQYLEALDARHVATHKELYLVLDNGPAHRSQASKAELKQREDWLHVVWLSRYSPQLNPKEREWRSLKRDTRSHLTRELRGFVDEIAAGLRRLGGERCDIVDQVPEWFIDGHRQPPTGRPRGRPKGTKNAQPRRTPSQNLPAPT